MGAVWDLLSSWAGLIQWLLTGFVGLVWYSIQRRFVSKHEHGALERQVSDLDTTVKNLPSREDFLAMEQHVRGEIGGMDKRVTAIETAVKGLPTKDDHHELMLKLTTMIGKVDVVDQKVAAVAHQTNRTEEFLLKGR